MPPIPPQAPKTMKGVVIEQTGGPDVLQYQTSLPIPSPGENEVLIKNSYIGLNYIDTYYRTGLYSPKPEILGCEAEGTVVRVGTGETHGLQPGDRVVYMAPSGTYAEFTCAPSLRVVKVPSGIPDTHAVAAFLQGLTALVLIREAHPVQKGDWVLVHAAAGGCGLWLCQLLRMVGARTIGTASSREKLELAQKFGAGWTVDYTAENVVERVDEITDGQGVIAVFDGVGKVTFDADLEMLSRKGSLVSFGNASGDVPPFHIRRLAAKNLKLVRPRLHGYITTREEVEKYTSELFEFMMKEKEGERLDVHIHDIYKLEDVRKAHEDIEGRKTTGKLLLKP